MSLREKIEGLQRTKQYLCRGNRDDNPWWFTVKLDDVLRIVAEHEQPIPDLTPGGAVKGPVGQAGGEPKRWDKSQPADQIPAYLCKSCNLEVEVGETFGSCPKCSTPMEMNPRWMKTPVGQAGGEPWRRGKLDLVRRKAWRGPWEVSEGSPDEPRSVYWFSEDGLRYGSTADQQTTPCDDPNWADTYLRPIGTTWVYIDQLATGEAEVEQVAGMQPESKP